MVSSNFKTWGMIFVIRIKLKIVTVIYSFKKHMMWSQSLYYGTLKG